jgi:hypothetical protein
MPAPQNLLHYYFLKKLTALYNNPYNNNNNNNNNSNKVYVHAVWNIKYLPTLRMQLAAPRHPIKMVNAMR